MRTKWDRRTFSRNQFKRVAQITSYRNQVMIDLFSLFFVQKPIHEEFFFYCSLHSEGASYRNQLVSRNHFVSGIITG